MRLFVHILDYVDTIDVFIDGVKLDIKKLSLFSKAEFYCNVDFGVHEISVVKKAEVLGRNWKRNIVFDWLSCLSGVPDWTLKEKEMDTKACSILLKIQVDRDIYITLKLKKHGFELVENAENILEIKKQTDTSNIAKKRIKYAYTIPTIILILTIEIGMLILGFFSVLSSRYDVLAIVIAFTIFWAWLSSAIFKNNK